MDPRPFHFDYRRPRPNNPTYQSFHLYDSIYHLSNMKYQNSPNSKYQYLQSNQQQKTNTPQSQPLQNKPLVPQRNQSQDLRNPQKIEINRYQSKIQIDKRQRVSSSLSHYGSNVMQGQIMDQNMVYQKQHRNFNIINLSPSPLQTILKQYPRLTLEDKIIDQQNSILWNKRKGKN